MPIYYPPPPAQGRTSGTPPEPHVPIGTQGSAPPRYSPAVMLGVVLAAWPAPLEPRLGRPNASQTAIAPLTLVYGTPPSPQGPLAVAEQALIGAAWPQPGEPRLGWPNASRTTIAPLTLVYGSQPSPQGPLAVAEQALIGAAWPVTWGAQTAVRSLAWATPLVPVVAYTSPPAQVWAAWVDPPRPPPQPVRIAPLTLVYGDAPPVGPITIANRPAIMSSWATPWTVGPRPASAAWNVTAPTATGDQFAATVTLGLGPASFSAGRAL